jgi:hypothetical protein
MQANVKAAVRPWAAMAAAAWLAAGCELDDGHDIDHTPAEGLGSLVVDNNTPDDIDVYVDSVSVGRARDDSSPAFDLKPGTHSVLLVQDDRDRNYRSDVDILAGRLTILRVSIRLDDDDYRVEIDYD